MRSSNREAESAQGSYKDDLTDFDETKVAEIRKGDTKRAEVERLFGQAGGLYTYPLIKTKRENALVYLYSQTRSAPFSVKMYLKKLVVTVDETGTVTDVEFNTSGEK
jgi:hypothetical protein